MGRAHGHASKDRKSKIEFTEDFKKKHEDTFPDVQSVSCKCKGKRHSKGCGCISDGLIESAKRNLLRHFAM